MRQRFIPADTIDEAKTEAPWAAEIFPCDGGFMAFESNVDAERWSAQA